MVRGNKKGPQAPHVSLSGPCHSRGKRESSVVESRWAPACAGATSYVKAFAAAALVLHVGIVEFEALIQALASEVQLRAFQELKALRIDDDLDPVALEGLVIRVDGVRVFDPVGKAGTARGAHAQAQAHALPSLGEEIGDVSRGAFGKRDHGSQAALASFSAGCARPCFLR